VTTGGQAALDLLFRLVLAEGDTVWMEEPGYLGARGALLAAGARLAPIAVGRDGWRLPEAGAPSPRLIYLTPSCQHPLGITMPLEARREVIAVARAAGGWVIEDDFDGEYTFRGPPLPAMQGLDAEARVIYVGTFAKTLFPSMRLGFAVLPEPLAERAKTALSLTGQFAPLVFQATLAEFIREGFFFRYLNRMRRLYTRRRAGFMRLLRDELGDWLDPIDGRTGIQIAAPFRVPLDDREAVARAAAEGIHAAPISLYFVGPPALWGLLLGYAGVAEPEMARAIPRLRRVLEGLSKG
jgi:GntR family transcriptional regulator/MocR family aminotransferase